MPPPERTEETAEANLGLLADRQIGRFCVRFSTPMKRIILCLTAFTLSGCGIITPMVRQESKLNRLEIGANRSDVVNKLGIPDHSRAVIGDDGKSMQTDEYRLFKPGTSIVNAILGLPFLTVTWWTPWLGDKFFDSYAVRYVDGRVSGWGRADEGQPKLVADITVKNR